MGIYLLPFRQDLLPRSPATVAALARNCCRPRQKLLPRSPGTATMLARNCCHARQELLDVPNANLTAKFSGKISSPTESECACVRVQSDGAVRWSSQMVQSDGAIRWCSQMVESDGAVRW